MTSESEMCFSALRHVKTYMSTVSTEKLNTVSAVDKKKTNEVHSVF
jgi:hypothetical protein